MNKSWRFKDLEEVNRKLIYFGIYQELDVFQKYIFVKQ